MKVAVIYTGAVRTLEQTIDNLLNNVLLNEDVHVFATLQSEDTPKYTDILLSKLGGNLKSLQWFFAHDSCWIQIRERLLDSMVIADLDEHYWKQYLRNSGSMIEYYQLYLSYLQLVKYETAHNFQYDYIVRVRTDVILTKPLHFSWLHMSDEEIQARITRICKKNLDSNTKVSLFMNSLIDDTRIDSDFISNECDIHPADSVLPTLLSSSNSEIREYIHNGRYILALRNNIVYIVKRKYAHLIPSIGVMFGMFKIPSDTYWFNAENQFRMICIHSQLSIFNSTTRLEHDSLYTYDPARYYDEHGNLRGGDLFFFLRRA